VRANCLCRKFVFARIAVILNIAYGGPSIVRGFGSCAFLRAKDMYNLLLITDWLGVAAFRWEEVMLLHLVVVIFTAFVSVLMFADLT
jgi:hypothetical protein